MADPRDELAALLRDARGHLDWLRDSGEHTLLRPPGAVKLLRPPRPEPAPAPAPRPATPARPAAPAPVARPATPPQPAAQPSLIQAPSSPQIGSSPDPVVRLREIREALGDCKRCKLCKSRNKIVYGVGDPKAEIVFVGEGPGADEDRTGEPFVGAAGQLLTKMIEAMGLKRSQVYIANCVKCRPPGNRNPENDELAACTPFLHAQLEAIKPKVIVTLGKFAAHNLLSETTPITRLRGNWRSYRGIKVMPTFHPSYLLRSPEEKGKAWADLQLVMKELGLKPPAKG